MTLYDRIADLRVRIDDYELEVNERDTSGGFHRVTTTVSLRGNGETGRGEDVIYDPTAHRALLASSGTVPLAGEYAFADFSTSLDEMGLFPGREPERDVDAHYRRWAVESAALDLALTQSDLTLADALGRTYDPVRFVVSTRLGDPPSIDRIRSWLAVDPALEFKLDPVSAWTPDLVDDLAATDAVCVLDFKGLYEDVPVAEPPNPDLYRRVVEAFPDVLLEDPALTEETRPLFEGVADRVTWDQPITGVESIEELPFQPRWLNVKPSRFGTVESLLDAIEHCTERGIRMYGGGQFELDVGRQHIHALAALFYPDGPNDVAPRAYNEPEPSSDVAGSPLAPPAHARGLEWTPSTADSTAGSPGP